MSHPIQDTSEPNKEAVPVQEGQYQFKPEELRVGSLVNFGGYTSEDKSYSIDAYEIEQCVNDDPYFRKHFSPIELTPDTLRRAGFEQKPGEWWQIETGLKDFKVSISLNAKLLHYDYGNDFITIPLPFEHLHRLQDFISCFGKELTLTPKP